MKVQESKKENKAWLYWSIVACFSFTLCNTSLSMLSTDVGAASVFYYSTGSVISGFVYQFGASYQNYRKNGVFWENMNLIIEGRLNKKNLLGYVAYTVYGVAMHLCILLNIYFATDAGINIGLVTIAWRASVFIGALLDYIYFK